ncbi:MAG: cytochrome c peroxidase [Bacteroidia bacterium]
MTNRRLLKIAFVAACLLMLASGIDLGLLHNYANQGIPIYIFRDNTPTNNPIGDRGATLGRVLFYDKQLSLNATTACASCHLQAFAFGDTAIRSRGFDGGLTERHSMRLVNARFSRLERFFWNKRAQNLEAQTTEPLHDPLEMGFSGTNGQPDLDSLLRRMATLQRYQILFPWVFGDSNITEQRISRALAQFVRSMQSFDSKYDIGRLPLLNDFPDFHNFSPDENAGKRIFLNQQPIGANCNACHHAPEFEIDPNSLNNGIINKAVGLSGIDLTNTRAPSLRDLINPAGQPNGPFMHNGALATIDAVIEHYNLIPSRPENTHLDNRLTGPGGNLQLTSLQKQQLAIFLQTLTGVDIYVNPKWADPFDSTGNLIFTGQPSSVFIPAPLKLKLYPNPTTDFVYTDLEPGTYAFKLVDMQGSVLKSGWYEAGEPISVQNLPPAIYLVYFTSRANRQQFKAKFVKG